MAQRSVAWHLNEAKKHGPQWIRRKCAESFQKMIRAEAGAMEGYVKAVRLGVVVSTYSPLGQVVCVTCSKRGGWNEPKGFGESGMDAGHYLSGRRNSILTEETNCHVQCTNCNREKSGAQDAYTLYMRTIYGQKVIDELVRLSNVSVQRTSEEWVARRLSYMKRTREAIERMIHE